MSFETLNNDFENQKSFNILQNNPEQLEGKKGSDVIDSIKTDITSRFANINDDETRMQIEKGLQSLSKFDGQLNIDQANTLLEIYQEFDEILSQEAGENAQRGKQVEQKKQQQTKETTRKDLIQVFEKLQKFIEENNYQKQKDIQEKNQKIGEIRLAELRNAKNPPNLNEIPPSMKESPEKNPKS